VEGYTLFADPYAVLKQLLFFIEVFKNGPKMTLEGGLKA